MYRGSPRCSAGVGTRSDQVLRLLVTSHHTDLEPPPADISVSELCRPGSGFTKIDFDYGLDVEESQT